MAPGRGQGGHSRRGRQGTPQPSARATVFNEAEVAEERSRARRCSVRYQRSLGESSQALRPAWAHDIGVLAAEQRICKEGPSARTVMVISDYERAKAIVGVTSGEYLGSFTDGRQGSFFGGEERVSWAVGSRGEIGWGLSGGMSWAALCSGAPWKHLDKPRSKQVHTARPSVWSWLASRRAPRRRG